MAPFAPHINISIENISSEVQFLVFVVSYPFILLMACWIVLANTLIITAVYTTVQLQQKMYHVMVSMAASDLLNGLTVACTYYIQARETIYRAHVCVLLFTCIMCSMLTSLLHVPLITVDRFIAVVYPLHYDIILPAPRIKALIGVVWVTAILLGCVPFVWYDKVGCNQGCDFRIVPGLYKVVLVGVLWFIIFPITCVLYIKIACAAWTQEDNLINLVPSRMDQDLQTTPNSGASQPTPTHMIRTYKAERKGARMVALALAIFLVCWSPLIWMVGLYGLQTLKGVSVRPLATYLDVAFALAFANSGMNFVVYALKSAELRAAFVRLLCCRGRAKVAPLR